MNGDADRLRSSQLSAGRYDVGLYAVNAAMFALYHRDVPAARDRMSRCSSAALLGPVSAEYGFSQKVRSRNGNRSTNSGPRGCYATSDGHWIAVSGSTPKMAERFLESYGLGHLLQDPRFATNEARVRHVAELDKAVYEAIGERTLEANIAIIDANNLTAQPVQTIRDIEADPHWQAQELLVDVPDGHLNVRMHNVIPRLSETRGEVRSAGGDLGADNHDIYVNEFGLDEADLTRLREDGIV
jgi:crotonobetainyl-CoA:carnitine CoA-transferase CaiB-like acyl-CoA transferase